MGVPTVACPCRVCHSSDPHDNRTRPSILLSGNGGRVVIDTTPDFRFQALREKIDRLDAVVKRFLDFARPMDVHLEPTQLSELLKEVLEIARPQLQKSNVQVAQLLPIGVPEVFADRALLKQAVLNLVLNAIEAMPNGGKLLLTLNRRGYAAEITVGDTGKGIPLENRQKIFQLFFTTRPGGSGIGLASAFRIVQLHNGSIDFTSEVGRGTPMVGRAA